MYRRYSLRAGLVLFPLMSLAAVFAFLSANNADVVEFRYLFIAFTCLQSVFIVIAYVLLSKEVCGRRCTLPLLIGLRSLLDFLCMLTTFHVRHSRGEMYSGDGRLCVCLSVPHCIPTLLHRPRCRLGNGGGCALVVQYWVDLQSVHRFCCYGSIAPNAKCQLVLVFAVCLVNTGAPEEILWGKVVQDLRQCQSTEGDSKHRPQPVAWPHPLFIHHWTPEIWGVGEPA